MNGPVSAFAPGKLILFGEHAVVHGQPAIAAAVDLGTQVQIEALDGPSRILEAELEDPRLWPALSALLPPQGLGLRIRSSLPTGRGMGSSAALSIALVRALARWEGREAGIEEQLRLGFVLERSFHGNPSGLDHTVSALGGALHYRRGPAGIAHEPQRLAPLQLVVLDTGRAGDTAALVAGVSARRPAVDPTLAAIGALVERMRPALECGEQDRIGAGMAENQALLRALGVSSPEIEDLVSWAGRQGALGAKLAGAGGGGVVIALAPDPSALLDAARREGRAAIPVTLGQDPQAAQE